jgi:hypothetical protein
MIVIIFFTNEKHEVYIYHKVTVTHITRLSYYNIYKTLRS